METIPHSNQEKLAFPKNSPLAQADRIIYELLCCSNKEYVSSETFTQLANQMLGPGHLQARIYFLTQLHQIAWEFPDRIFQTPERRDLLLKAIQDALDQEILQEE